MAVAKITVVSLAFPSPATVRNRQISCVERERGREREREREKVNASIGITRPIASNRSDRVHELFKVVSTQLSKETTGADDTELRQKMVEAAQGQLPAHPYVPADLQLPGYVPVSLSMSTILGVYLMSALFIVSLVWVFSGWLKKISKIDRLLMCWWIFTGLTHMILEGYFAFSPEFYKDNTCFYLAEVWKEYSKGDSRYAARDSGIVTVEGITAVLEGPASILAVYAIAGEKSYSYILQFAISLGQLYGTVVYFVTSILEGDNFASSTFYYYAYYVIANSFWILVPGLISMRCWKKICEALQSKQQPKTKLR